MRAALVVNRVSNDPAANLEAIAAAVEQAADRGAELLLLPEAAVTGLINNDDAAHDLPLGQTIPAPTTRRLASIARRRRLYLAFGILERTDDVLYDSAVMLSPDGTILVHYRRIQPQWHGRDADPTVYRQGSAVPVADTPLGRFAVIICGDLFDDAVIARLRSARPDWLLLPFARNFSDGAHDQERWDSAEMPSYLARVRQAARTTLMVNYVSHGDPDRCFGGATVVSASGEIIASLPLGSEGTLHVDLPRPSRCGLPKDSDA